MKKEKSCGCIIFDNNKVLIIKQTKGHWGFPKGHIEENETEEETAVREVKEETGIDVEILSGQRYSEEYITDKGNQKEVVYFIAKKIDGKEKPQDGEVTEIEWLNFEEAIEKITYNNTKKLFKNILKKL